MRSLAADAMRLVTSEGGDKDEARRLGVALFELGPPVPAVAPGLQAAWLTAALEALPPERAATQRFDLIRLGGELALGFWSAHLKMACATDAVALQRLRHDLKTPLNSITGFSKVILRGLDGPITDLQREDLTTVFESGQRLLEMIDDVMGAMERDAIHKQGACDLVDVAALLGDLVTTAQPLLAAHGHQLHLELAGRLGILQAPYAQTRWALFGLVLAMSHLAENARITVAARHISDDEGAAWDIGVAGEGMARDIDTQDLEETLRLGTLRQFCARLDGQLTLKTEEPGALRVEIRLPDTPGETS